MAKKKSKKQIESLGSVKVTETPPEPCLRESTVEDFAEGFDYYAELITEKRNSFAYRQGDPELKVTYDDYRKAVERWRNFAIRDLKNCPLFPDVPVLIGNEFFAGMINLEDCCKSCAAILRGKDKRRPKLGKTASLIYEKLLTLPEHKAMQLPEIVAWLWENHEINLTDSTVHQKHLTQLEPWGLQHDPRIGYSIDQNKKV